MRKILIGSKALNYFYKGVREPNDTDYAVDQETSSGTEGVEYLYNPIIFKYTNQDICPPDLLLALKVSHLFWETNWDKHMFDVQYLLSKGWEIDRAFVKEMREFWNTYLPKVRRSDLAMDKESFFTNAINYDEHEHDFLHTLIAETPAYTKLLKDGCEVELDENKWLQLSHEEKLDVVFEETAVMAYERMKNLYFVKAYQRMLKKCIISHFPDYIAIFAIENYKECLKPKFNFINTIQDGLQKSKRCA